MTVASVPDVVYACVHLAPRVCRPCRDVADCKAAFSAVPMRCADLGGHSFCVRDCSGSGSCEDGFDCRAVGSAGVAGGAVEAPAAGSDAEHETAAEPSSCVMPLSRSRSFWRPDRPSDCFPAC